VIVIPRRVAFEISRDLESALEQERKKRTSMVRYEPLSRAGAPQQGLHV
jgi:hypothetical protein